MARRSFSGREFASPCSSGKASSVIRAIQRMRDKQVNLAKQPFTLPELMEMFIKPEHREHLMYAYKHVEPSGITSTLYVKVDVPPEHAQYLTRHRDNDGCFMKFSWYGRQEDGFYVPEQEGSEERWAITSRYSGTASPELLAKYDQVVSDLIDIQSRFALCERVFRNLNNPEYCKTLPQMRYVWPAIQILLKRAGFNEDAKAIAEASARAGDKVSIPPWLGNLLKETNDTIVRALMLDDMQDPGDDTLPVNYYLSDSFAAS